jgi:hypothetical protein
MPGNPIVNQPSPQGADSVGSLSLRTVDLVTPWQEGGEVPREGTEMAL